ncbi:hypothetical protein RRG08_022196 [Elysia crispata]|uniref:Uncharacterized protein n=1 Tax=Elysia crispata TaxID=231223 RepID=A0AAE1D695_9GAST|nr:hypothetical protein RRG08_022196 [Elysia crispata]
MLLTWVTIITLYLEKWLEWILKCVTLSDQNGRVGETRFWLWSQSRLGPPDLVYRTHVHGKSVVTEPIGHAWLSPFTHSELAHEVINGREMEENSGGIESGVWVGSQMRSSKKEVDHTWMPRTRRAMSGEEIHSPRESSRPCQN